MFKKIILLTVFHLLLIDHINSQELVPYCKNGLYGYSDLKGKMKIEPQFRRAQLFEKGIAIVSKEGKDYLINTKGKLITPSGYDDLESTERGYYVAAKGDSCGLIDNKGNIKIPIIYAGIDAKKATLTLKNQDNTYSILNSEFKEILKTSGGMYFDIDRDQALYSMDYDVKINENEIGRSVVLNEKGDIVFGPVDGEMRLEMDYQPFNLYKVRIKNSVDSTEFYGLLSEKGKVIIPAKYDDLSDDFKPLSFSLSWEIENLGWQRDSEKAIKLLKSDKTQSNLCIVGISGLRKDFYNLKGQIVPPLLKLDLKGGTIMLSYKVTTDSSGNETTKYNLFNAKGEKITKKDLVALHKNEGFFNMGLIVCTYDSLWGAFKLDGSEYLPFIYKKIDLDKNNMIGLKSSGDKVTFFKYPAAPPQPIDGKGWYTEVTQTNSSGLIKTTLEGDAVRYGLLDSTGKELLAPIYQNLNLMDDVALIEEDAKNRSIVTGKGKKIPIAENTSLMMSLNGAKEQSIFMNRTEIYFQSGKSKQTLLAAPDSILQFAFIQNKLQEGGNWYFSIMLETTAAIFKFEKGKIKQLHDFDKVDLDKSQSTYAIPYFKADSTCNFVTLKGKVVVPYGNWTYLQDLMSSSYQAYKEKNNYFFVNTTKDASVFNNEGKKIYDCKNCILDPAETLWDLNEYLLYVNPVNTSAKTFNLIYDKKSGTFLDVPFDSEGEQLNDTLYLLKDTLRNSYLYYWTQNLLKKLPFKSNYHSTCGEEDIKYQFQDENEDWYFLNNKTLETVKIPGKMPDFGPFLTIYDKTNPRDYFHFTIEVNGQTKKGVVTELGKVLIDAKYDQLDMSSEYEEYPFFSGKNGEYTDIINIKGEVVSPANKKYTAFYFHDEYIMIAESDENGVAYADMYNSHDNFKRINHSVKSEGLEPNLFEINGTKIIRYPKTMIVTKKEGNETYEEEIEYYVYINEDGTPYFEFDSSFK